jgi:hypothetical protein
MSWSDTYTHTIALAADFFGAALFWNQQDITISSLCWMACTNDPRLAGLTLYKWQTWLLLKIGPLLNDIQTNHMALARAADVARAERVLALLQ